MLIPPLLDSYQETVYNCGILITLVLIWYIVAFCRSKIEGDMKQNLKMPSRVLPSISNRLLVEMLLDLRSEFHLVNRFEYGFPVLSVGRSKGE